MRRRVTVQDFERTLEGMQGGIALFRDGIDEFFLSHGFDLAREKLAAVKQQLERLSVYEICERALHDAEALVRQGPEFDEQAESLILEANRALMKASGTYDAMARRFRPANEPKV